MAHFDDELEYRITSAYLSLDQWRWATNHAALQGVSFSAFVRHLIDEARKRHEGGDDGES